MGIAAYNRGSRVIAERIDAEQRPVEFEIMERLNALEKYADAGRPFGPIQFSFDNNLGVWWAQCPVTGFGFMYHDLHEAVKRWRVVIVAFDSGNWIAEPV